MITLCLLDTTQQTEKAKTMKLSKTDTKALNIMLQHAANGNTETFERLIASWLRSAPSDLVLTKRRAALSAIMGRIEENRAA